MVWINFIKKALGIKSVRPYEFTDDPVEDKAKIDSATESVEPVVVKPKAKKEKTTKQTKATLGKMTKIQIDDLAKEKLGVELDRRQTKDKMIAEFMKAQKDTR